MIALNKNHGCLKKYWPLDLNLILKSFFISSTRCGKVTGIPFNWEERPQRGSSSSASSGVCSLRSSPPFCKNFKRVINSHWGISEVLCWKTQMLENNTKSVANARAGRHRHMEATQGSSKETQERSTTERSSGKGHEDLAILISFLSQSCFPK